MVLFVIGLGLADEQDITLKGLEAIKSCEHVYLEAYTSILMVPDYQQRLEKLYGKSVTLATRETVELQADDLIIQQSKIGNVAFLVVGDPLSATTHTDLILRARSQKVVVKVIHNASIMTAIGSSGLQGYNFGQTVSIPFWTDEWKPDSWLERIGENFRIGCHTLCLGDIKVREQSQEDMARGRLVYQPPRYMLIPQLITQLLEADLHHQTKYMLAHSTLAIALCRMGNSSSSPSSSHSKQQDGELIVSGTLHELLALSSASPEELVAEEAQDEEEVPDAGEAELAQRRAARAEQRAMKAFGAPLHSLVLVGKRLHPLERDYAAQYMVPGSQWMKVAEDVYGCR
ncbi:Diphthine synthase [Tilletiaria anomala UBC 951]|uniref:diphthine methyl ester synthase n=1 Tax=Tilletiaria anomala (strain ATCC 24038 / CBS 436.72 / UBC 951) TaxID=1037660 RepID=A0A066W6K4_TILAU|nr:Diphthine synthase [Tilletiaria anomala UBC 951]KDN48183.1 Diphthine synthase [Tilletiaria anomala UBC 951]